MIDKLTALCERHGLELYISYNIVEGVWDCDVYDGKTIVFNSIIFKAGLMDLLETAYNITIEYVNKKTI